MIVREVFGEGQRASRVPVCEQGGIAPVLWADADIVPEHSEWDAVRVG